MEYASLVKPPLSKVLKSGRVRLQSGENVGKHMTDDREEILIILEGTATIIESGKESTVSAGNHHYIPVGIEHDVKNDTDGILEYIYVVALFDGETGYGHHHEHSHEHSHSHEHTHEHNH